MTHATIPQASACAEVLPMRNRQRLLFTIAEAAEALGVSQCHIKRLVAEADANRRSRWRWGRELVDLSPVGAQRRTVRVNVGAVVPFSTQQNQLTK